jgi:hypothetical protein
MPSRITKTIDKKFLIVAPAFRDWDLGNYLEKLCIAKKIRCKTFAYRSFNTGQEANTRLLEIARDYRPKVMLGIKMERIYPDTIKAIKQQDVFSVLWQVDCFGEEVPQDLKLLLKEVDLFFTTAKGMVLKYAALGQTPVYWMHEGVYLPAFPLKRLAPYWRRTYTSQVAFIGNIFQPPVSDKNLALRRFKLLKSISQKYRLKIWGSQGDTLARKKWGASDYPVIAWPAYHEEMVKICQAAKIVLGINTVNTVELYFSNRTFLTLAGGGFHLTHYVPGLEEMFRNHRHLVWFKSDRECLDLIDYYLKRPRLRKRIAGNGQRLVRRRYTMRKQFNRMLNIIDAHYAK